MKRADVAALPVGTVLGSAGRDPVILVDNKPHEITIRRRTTHSGSVARSVQVFQVRLITSLGQDPGWGAGIRTLAAGLNLNGTMVHLPGWSRTDVDRYEGWIEPRYLDFVLAPNVEEWTKIKADEKAAAAAEANLKARRKAAMVKLAGEMDSNWLRSHSGSFEIEIKVDDMLAASDLIEHYGLSGDAKVTITFGLIDEAAVERIGKG